jgi:hypothetical protein
MIVKGSRSVTAFCHVPVRASVRRRRSFVVSGVFNRKLREVKHLMDYWAVTHYNNWKFVSGLYWRRRRGYEN